MKIPIAPSAANGGSGTGTTAKDGEPKPGATIDWAPAGGTLLGASLLGAFLFGFINHYVLQSPDNVAQVPATEWGNAFIWSAHALAVTELGGVLAALWLLQASRKTTR